MERLNYEEKEPVLLIEIAQSLLNCTVKTATRVDGSAGAQEKAAAPSAVSSGKDHTHACTQTTTHFWSTPIETIGERE